MTHCLCWLKWWLDSAEMSQTTTNGRQKCQNVMSARMIRDTAIRCFATNQESNQQSVMVNSTVTGHRACSAQRLSHQPTTPQPLTIRSTKNISSSNPSTTQHNSFPAIREDSQRNWILVLFRLLGTDILYSPQRSGFWLQGTNTTSSLSLWRREPVHHQCKCQICATEVWSHISNSSMIAFTCWSVIIWFSQLVSYIHRTITLRKIKGTASNDLILVLLLFHNVNIQGCHILITVHLLCLFGCISCFCLNCEKKEWKQQWVSLHYMSSLLHKLCCCFADL